MSSMKCLTAGVFSDLDSSIWNQLAHLESEHGKHEMLDCRCVFYKFSSSLFQGSIDIIIEDTLVTVEYWSSCIKSLPSSFK